MAIEPKLPAGYYVYTISVDGVVRYIGKGKGPRLYSHMKEVRNRLNRHYRLRPARSLQGRPAAAPNRSSPSTTMRFERPIEQPVRRPGEGDLLGKEVATASVLATTAKAAAPRVSVTQSYPGRALAAGSNSAFPSQLSRARTRADRAHFLKGGKPAR